MIQYARKILPKVSTWETLFRKELAKIYNWMPEEQMNEFRSWCYGNFQKNYSELLNEIFYQTSGENKLMGKAGQKKSSKPTPFNLKRECSMNKH